MEKVLITGGFGYVGSRLAPHLLGLGYDVTVIDLFLYGDAGLKALEASADFPSWKERFNCVKADIRDPKALDSVLAGRDAVVHLAAISNDPTGQIDEVLTRQVNFDAVGMLIALSRKRGIKRFINASSSSVFGIKSDANVSEALEPEPLTFYSKYKMLAEWLVLTASGRDFCAVNIRPATICGFSPRQRFDLTVNKLTADAVRKKVITVHGGRQRRPNVGMTDMVNLYAALLRAEPALINGRTFNFGFENLKVIEIAKIIQGELADLKVDIKVTETVDQRDYHISAEKITKMLGYRPVSSIKQEVANLRNALESGFFPDIDDDAYYNMKTMALSRCADPYGYLGR